jgi:hypothetical protein
VVDYMSLEGQVDADFARRVGAGKCDWDGAGVRHLAPYRHGR